MTKLGLDFCPQFLLCFWSPMMSESTNVASLGAMPTAQPSNTGIRKQWHEDITQDLRNHLVHKLWVASIKTICCWVSCCFWGGGSRRKPGFQNQGAREWVLSGPVRRESRSLKDGWSCICCFGAVVVEVSRSVLKPWTALYSSHGHGGSVPQEQ